jgi:hypothetical protein
MEIPATALAVPAQWSEPTGEAIPPHRPILVPEDRRSEPDFWWGWADSILEITPARVALVPTLAD